MIELKLILRYNMAVQIKEVGGNYETKSKCQHTPLFADCPELPGDVHYLTPEGDDLNLKSALAQFLFAAVVAGQLKELPGDIRFQDPEDVSVLQRYLL